jgi:hypothetical protein
MIPSSSPFSPYFITSLLSASTDDDRVSRLSQRLEDRVHEHRIDTTEPSLPTRRAAGSTLDDSTAAGSRRAATDSLEHPTENPMKAVLIEVDVTGVETAEGVAVLREQIVPAISAMPGFLSGTWLTGGADGRGLSLTVWDSTEHAQAFGDQFGIGASPAANALVTRCELRDVAATA